MTQRRKIIHIDMDAFYAAVEIQDEPALQGKALVVGGSPQSRGVVATCNYEARKYGIHSAMSCSEAKRRCPQAVFVPPRMQRYQEISSQIRNVFLEVSECMEPLSLDEAYLDVTHNRLHEPNALKLAKDLKARILAQTGLTASAGIGPNKLIAKIASDINKPDGLTQVFPHQAYSFLSAMPVSKIWGVGKARLKQLEKLGYGKISDLQQTKLTTLMTQLGNFGSYLFYAAQGIDDRPVKARRQRKSSSTERTFDQDIQDSKILLQHLETFSGELLSDLNKYKARCVTLKLRFDNFETLSRSKTFSAPLTSQTQLFGAAQGLLNQIELKRGVRLLGLGISSFEAKRAANHSAEQSQQLSLC